MNRNDAPALIERPLRYIYTKGLWSEREKAVQCAKRGDGETVKAIARDVYIRQHAKVTTKKGIFK